MLLVAEIGINHNGDMELAHRLIDAAVDSGANAVKFQNYHTEEFATDAFYEYPWRGGKVTESQKVMFKRCELKTSELVRLKEHCKARKVTFFSTPMSERGLKELTDIGVTLLKNGSDCLTHLPLIRAMAKTGLPTMMSVGMAELPEIAQAEYEFYAGGGKELTLLHCTSAYPAPDKEVNLLRIPELASLFKCPVGLSDHSQGITAALGATALGAIVIEKHFTLDKAMFGPDHAFSADPEEFKAMTEAVRKLEQQLGMAEIRPTAAEMKNREQFRVTCQEGQWRRSA